MRKQILRFDDILNDQRKIIYQNRREILNTNDQSKIIEDMISDYVNYLIDIHDIWNIIMITIFSDICQQLAYRAFVKIYPKKSSKSNSPTFSFESQETQVTFRDRPQLPGGFMKTVRNLKFGKESTGLIIIEGTFMPNRDRKKKHLKSTRI